MHQNPEFVYAEFGHTQGEIKQRLAKKKYIINIHQGILVVN
jgi:hypothetical protein